MQPLGLTSAQLNRYRAHLFSSHDFGIGIDVLRLDESPITSIEPTLLDGQVNVSQTEAVQRTATFTFYDPDRTLHLDAFTPWEGALYADRMIRVHHTATVPGVGRVTATPFVGPVVKLSRDGDTVAAECQDKSSLAMTGARPFKMNKGANAVGAIRKILSDCTGERHFRFPSGNKKQLPKAYNVGWAAEAAPWQVCQRIARQVLGMDLFYSCDGYATLRARVNTPALTVTDQAITEPIKADFDITATKNRVMVNGSVPSVLVGQYVGEKKKTVDTYYNPVSAAAQVTGTHPLHPNKLGRNGVPRFLPLVDSGAKFKKAAEAGQRARTLLASASRMSAEVTFAMVPVFDLDVLDILRVETDRGYATVRFISGSIPLGVSGEMSVGQVRPVARGRRA